MTIEEMARGYMYLHTLEDICANPFDRMKDAYWDGANAVLEEIEKLSKSLGDSEGFHYNFYVEVMKLVEQLKK